MEKSVYQVDSLQHTGGDIIESELVNNIQRQ